VSRTIITIIRSKVLSIFKPLRQVSEMISLEITKIIVAAANANPGQKRRGNRGHPIVLLIGSTMPVRSATMNAARASSPARERDRHREPVGQVLQADADRARVGAAGITGAVADPDREALREIVRRDRDHQQPCCSPARRRRRSP
jgi:hypothetical protein